MRRENSLKIQARNIGFSGIQCTTLGLFLLEACLAQLGARPVAHLASVVVGTAIMSSFYRHIKAYEPKPMTYIAAANQEKGSRLLNISDLLSALFLISFGYMGALIAGGQWATPSALYAICLFLFPWSKIALCRKHLPASWLVMNVGVASGSIAEGLLPHPIALGISAWVFWTAATGAWFRLIFLKREKSSAIQEQDHDEVKESPEVMHQ